MRLLLHRHQTSPRALTRNTVAFLRKFAVPFWALSEVFGRSPMYWHRLECSLGRFSLVGTTVQAANSGSVAWYWPTTSAGKGFAQ